MVDRSRVFRAEPVCSVSVAATDRLAPATKRPRAHSNRGRPARAASLKSPQEGADEPGPGLLVRMSTMGGTENAA